MCEALERERQEEERGETLVSDGEVEEKKEGKKGSGVGVEKRAASGWFL